MDQREINRIVRNYGLVNYGRYINRTIHDSNVTRSHMEAVNELTIQLLLLKKPFLTGYTMVGKNGRYNKPDILVLQEPLVGIEVLHTETLERFENKIKKSQEGLYLVKVSTSEVLSGKIDIEKLL